MSDYLCKRLAGCIAGPNPRTRARKQALEAETRARLWFLPPYSPDLNPIEQAFAKIKHWMPDAQKRSVEDICQHLGTPLTTIEPRERQNYIRNAGYGST